MCGIELNGKFDRDPCRAEHYERNELYKPRKRNKSHQYAEVPGEMTERNGVIPDTAGTQPSLFQAFKVRVIPGRIFTVKANQRTGEGKRSGGGKGRRREAGSHVTKINKTFLPLPWVGASAFNR